MELRRLLALDQNGNGKIDNQGELFGNTATYANGFLTLQSMAPAGISLQTYSNNNAEFGKSQVT
jgi:hypothetical protein